MNDKFPFEKTEIREQKKALRQQIEQLLPEIFRQTLESKGDPLDPLLDDNPLNVFVEVMAQFQAFPAAVLDNLPAYFQINSAPESFVIYMASWFNLTALWLDDSVTYRDYAAIAPFPTGTERLRLLLASIRELTQTRGTTHGLMHFLELATGLKGFVIKEGVRDERGRVIPFEIHVHVPSEALAYLTLIRRIVARERPAYATYQIILIPPTDPMVRTPTPRA